MCDLTSWWLLLLQAARTSLSLCTGCSAGMHSEQNVLHPSLMVCGVGTQQPGQVGIMQHVISTNYLGTYILNIYSPFTVFKSALLGTKVQLHLDTQF